MNKKSRYQTVPKGVIRSRISQYRQWPQKRRKHDKDKQWSTTKYHTWN